MPIKPVDVKVFSVEVAETIYSKIVAELGYTSMDITGVDYVSAEPENVLIDYFPKNQIVYEISEIVDRFAVDYLKVIDDSLDVPDHSSYVMSKNAGNEILNVIEHYAADVLKVFNDTAVVEHFVRLILTKAFDDYLVTLDAYQITIEQNKYDAVVAQDAFDRVVSYVRHFQDYVSVDDWAGIDKFFTGVKTNVAGAIDHSDYAFAKVLKDTSIASDIALLLTTKNFSHAVSIPDEHLFLLEKVFNDSAVSTDQRIASFLKVLADDLTVPDHYVADFTKVRADSVASSDNFIRTVEFIRSPNDLVGTQETTNYVVNKPLKDYPLFVDRNRGILRKPLFDNTTASDFIAAAYSLAKADSVSTPDTTNYSVNKVLADAAIALDVLVFTSQLVYADTVAVDDNIALTSIKPAYDTFGFLDAYELGVVKNVEDSVDVPDTLNFSLNAVLNDSVTTLTDVSKIFKLKAVTDYYNATDAFTRTIDYHRSFYDTVVLDDFMTTEGVIGASKFNAATATDTLATSTNKVLENPCFIVDSPAIIYTKYALDTVNTQDFSVLSSIKGITEEVPVTDTIDIVAIVGTTSIFNAFAFNTSTFG